ncbi:MAG: hypothetical protein GY835_11750 [bacterium]|nr:hypothetical protein [bacterium]
MMKAERKPEGSGEEIAPAARTEEPQEATEGTFTRYVKALAARSEALDRLAEEMLAELRKILVREMRRRSLWASPPSYVGVYGWPTWTPGDTERTTPPLDELVSDCYTHIFCMTLPQLLNQLRVNPAIDGLVVFYLRNFLHQRQKDHDPLGYRIFEVVRDAVRDAVSSEELHVLKGTREIRNDTILGAASDADPDKTAAAADLDPLVARWNNDLMPDLVTTGGAERRQMSGRLRGHLFDLEAEGTAVVRFKDLVDAFKHDVRARWADLYEQAEGEVVVEHDAEGVPVVIRLFRPSMRAEDVDSFRKQVRCVAERIEKLGGQERTRRHLARLWSFLRRFAIDEAQEGLPSHRRLEALLGIPRERFPEFYETLGRLIRRCQAALSGKVVELDAGRRNAGGRNG